MTTQTNRSEDRLDRVERLLEQLAERQIHTDNRMDRADARMGRLKNALEATDRLITRNSEQLDRTDKLIDRNAKQIDSNSEQLDRTEKLITASRADRSQLSADRRSLTRDRISACSRTGPFLTVLAPRPPGLIQQATVAGRLHSALPPETPFSHHPICGRMHIVFPIPWSKQWDPP